ncbi:uncharacterized protein PRCAT00005563001 [Priceomyces carsonii]|uniref:uncharacterized protein n=1 Tax=Priceomyces carsonii TaxID=28549 RepID=UPI002ED8039E|nr:unnamed protein product [Priceomyces carsonii]
MADPAASIKSIISGRVKMSSMDWDSVDSNNSNTAISDYQAFRRRDESEDSRNPKTIGYSESQGEEATKQSHVYSNGEDSLASLSSGTSDNQKSYLRDSYLSPTPDDGSYTQLEAILRPSSRNSTTSCFSTMATKDGVEGKKFHRNGPTAYSNSIMASMVHQQALQNYQQLQQQVDVSGTESINSSTRVKPSFFRSFTGNSNEGNQSQVSIKTTNAEHNGEMEEKKTIGIDQIPNSEPPFTLKEKINLLNTPKASRT